MKPERAPLERRAPVLLCARPGALAYSLMVGPEYTVVSHAQLGWLLQVRSSSYQTVTVLPEACALRRTANIPLQASAFTLLVVPPSWQKYPQLCPPAVAAATTPPGLTVVPFTGPL